MAEEKDKKTKRPTALKRDLQNEKRRLQNRSFTSKLKTTLRKAENGDSSVSLKEVHSLLDKAVKKNIFKKNKANRLKARFFAKTSH